MVRLLNQIPSCLLALPKILVLWPLFHYLLWQDVAAESVNSDNDWKAYLLANEAYAAQVAAIYNPGDLIWIHDYHLLLVPAILRRLKPEAFVGLFVHTPFPSSEIFRCLPSNSFLISLTDRSS